MITWKIEPQTVQLGMPVTLTGEGFDPLQHFAVTVESPTDLPFTWKLQADPTGRIVDELYLASGHGRYNFIAASCNIEGARSVLVGCCPVQEREDECKLVLYTNRNAVQIGNQVVVDIEGLVPHSTVHLLQQGPGAPQLFTLVADAQGWATKPTSLEAAGIYSFVGTQGACASLPVSVQSIGNINPLPTVNQAACVGALTTSVSFVQPEVSASGAVLIVLTVANRSQATKFLNLTVPLPAGLVGVIQLTQEPIAANSSRDFPFYAQVNNPTELNQQLTLQIRPEQGTYQCNGATYFVEGSAAVVTVLASLKPCGIEVVSAGFNLSQVRSGESVIFSLRVKNVGQAAINNLTLTSLVPPTALGTTPLQFAGVPLPAGAEYTYTQALVASGAAQVVAVLSIPAGHITATCQGQTVATIRRTTASIVVTP